MSISVQFPDEVLEFVKNTPSYDDLTSDTDDRYDLHKARLQSIIKSEIGESLDCLYFSDYKQSIQNNSKCNWYAPIFCRKKYYGSIFNMLIAQATSREYLGGFSFSDFIFRDLDKKTIIRFERSESFDVESYSLPYIQRKITVQLPVENRVRVDDKFEIKTKSNEWRVQNLQSIIDQAHDFDIEDKPVRNEYKEKIYGKGKLDKFKNEFRTDGNEIRDYEYDDILEVMFSSLAFDDIKAFTYIPNISLNKENKQESSGGMVIPEFIKGENLSPENERTLFWLTQVWFDKNAIADFSESAKNQILKQTRRAAISQVMARNMSHNMGSHVLSKLTNKNQIKKIADQKEAYRKQLEKKIVGTDKVKKKLKVFNKYCGDEDSLNNKEILKQFQYLGPHPDPNTRNLESKNKDIWEKIAHFNSYIKSRMDFLADIATGIPTLENINYFYNEVIAGFDKNRILLDRISGVSDFYYKLQVFDCRNCKGEVNCNESCECTEVSLKNSEDFQVAMPNDILGHHAFYVILENIIRNTAKHTNNLEDGKIVNFNIEIRECPNDNSFYEVQVYDKVEINDKNVSEQDHNETNDENITDEEPREKIDKTISDLNTWLNKSILNSERNKVRQGGWGLIEMKVSAAYLRKIPIEEIDDELYDIDFNKNKSHSNSNSVSKDSEDKPLNILKAFKKVKEDKEYLGYRFFIMKPKEVLVILDKSFKEKVEEEVQDSIDWNSIESELKNYGIWLAFKGEKDSSDELELYEPEKVYAHEFLLNLTQDENFKGTDPFLGGLPDRTLIKSEYNNIEDFQGLLINSSSEEAENFKNGIWEDYCKTKSFSDVDINMFDINQKGLEFPTNGNFKAKFLDHGTGWNDNFESFLKDDIQFLEIATSSNNISEVLHQSASTITDRTNQDSNNDETEADGIVLSKLKESIFKKVIILDERIQEAAFSLKYDPGDKNIPYYKIYLANGIYIPDNDFFDLSKKSYRTGINDENIQEILNGKIKFKCGVNETKNVRIEDANYLVLHLGVIEKFLAYKEKRKNKPEEEKKEIRKFLDELLNDYNIKLIIVSGRGKPGNLPENLPYLNYSALSQYCIDNRSKYLLSELLLSSRKLKDKNNE